MLDGAFAVRGVLDGKANKFGTDAGCEAIEEIRNSEAQMNIVNDVLAQDLHCVFKQLHGDSDFFFFVAKGKCLCEIVSAKISSYNHRLCFGIEPHWGRFGDEVA